jgi:hypothetical protein
VVASRQQFRGDLALDKAEKVKGRDIEGNKRTVAEIILPAGWTKPESGTGTRQNGMVA